MSSSAPVGESAVFVSDSKYEELASCIKAQLADGNVLLLVRGIPGTGKSSLGKRIASAFQGVQYESDNNFIVDGEYQYDPSLLAESHEITQSAVRQAMAEGKPLVVVTNTFTRSFESEPYIAAAEQANYAVVIFDLFQHILSLVGQEHKDQYLRFLANNNVHGVPAAKIKEMSERYQFGASELSVLDRSSESLSTKRRKMGHNWTRLLDTKYYLALEIRPAERNSRQHSPLFLACLYACLELIEWIDFSSLYPMIKQMVNRNLRSHAKQTGCSVNSLAGWTQLHVTLLNPSEYDALASAQLLDAFKQEVDALRLDAIHDAFAPLLADPATVASTPAPTLSRDTSVNLPTTYAEARRCVSQHIGVVQGPRQVDSEGSKDCGTHRFRHIFPGNDISTSFYLTLPPSPFLQSLAQLRDQYLTQAGYRQTVEEEEAWCPHITLAFSHHDIHPADRQNGRVMYQTLRPPLLDDRTQPEPPASSLDLQEDISQHAVELLLHSEVAVSISTAFGFQVLDYKIRKRQFGDDVVYRSHPILLEMLPRGLVFLQEIPEKIDDKGSFQKVWRGLSSLPKFFGKEGMEDDGPGWTSSEWSYHFQHQLQQCRSLASMEKVNGRAASARFFTWKGQLFLVIGTKLSHTVGRVDREQCCIHIDQEGLSSSRPLPPPVPPSSSEKEETGRETFLDSSDYRSSLIISNVKACEASLVWDKIDDLAVWLAGRTMNGEVVDPEEMHLVPLTELQWVHLCCTDFASFPPFSSSAPSPGTNVSFLEERQQAAVYYRFLPPMSFLPLEMTEANKRDILLHHMRQVVYSPHASEGQVLYFLDAQGRVLDRVKYKTWWYVYRRSIRQLVQRFLAQYYASPQSNQTSRGSARENGKNAGSKYDQRVQEQLERLQKIAASMSQAKKQDDPAFQAKLQSVHAQIQKIELQMHGEGKDCQEREGVDGQRLAGLTEEFEKEVQRKWLSKFSFMKEDLGEEAYSEQVHQVISLAVGFLRFLVQRLIQNEKDTIKQFKCYYPLLWEEFRGQNSPPAEHQT